MSAGERDSQSGNERLADSPVGAGSSAPMSRATMSQSHKASLISPHATIEAEESVPAFHRFRGADGSLRISNPWVLGTDTCRKSDGNRDDIRLTASWEPGVQHERSPNAETAATLEAPVALDGFCPVELHEFERWIKGNPRWTVVHRGRTYQMSGPGQCESFLNNPQRFAPVHNGLDPVEAAEKGIDVEGSTKHCLIYNDRLYMFSSAESANEFRSNPNPYVAK